MYDRNKIKEEAQKIQALKEEGLKKIQEIRESLTDEEKKQFDDQVNPKIEQIPLIIEEAKAEVLKLINAKFR